MNIGLSINKLKELTGGGASGITTWELWDSKTSNAVITLPSEFEEIEVVTVSTYSGKLMSYKTSFTKDQLSKIATVGTVKEGFSSTDYCQWNVTNTSVQIANLLIGNTNMLSQSPTSVTTYVYYKKKAENVINLGTESNWALWSEVTGSTGITLPSDFSELQIISSCSDYIDTGNSTVITKDALEQYELISKNKGYGYTAFSQGMYYYKVRDNILNLDLYNGANTKVPNCITKVYYKKKADNVLDVNDMGDWKEWASIPKASSYSFTSLPTGCKELLIVGILSTNKKATSSLCFPNDLIALATAGTTSSKSYYYLPYSSTQSISLYTNSGSYNITGSDDLDVKIYYR